MSAELHRSFDQLGKAVQRLGDALAADEHHPLFVDAMIQRFEFTIELFWKALKRLLAHEGIDAQTPREVLQRAYQVGWLDDEKAWLTMLRDRNETSHAYDEVLAQKICQSIRRNFPEMQRTLAALLQRLPPDGSKQG